MSIIFKIWKKIEIIKDEDGDLIKETIIEKNGEVKEITANEEGIMIEIIKKKMEILLKKLRKK